MLLYAEGGLKPTCDIKGFNAKVRFPTALKLNPVGVEKRTNSPVYREIWVSNPITDSILKLIFNGGFGGHVLKPSCSKL
jgi:hypothetical protein